MSKRSKQKLREKTALISEQAIRELRKLLLDLGVNVTGFAEILAERTKQDISRTQLSYTLNGKREYPHIRQAVTEYVAEQTNQQLTVSDLFN